MYLALIGLLVALGSGYTAGSIAESKGNPFGWFFLLGFLFPLVGMVVAVAVPRAAHDGGIDGNRSGPSSGG